MTQVQKKHLVPFTLFTSLIKRIGIQMQRHRNLPQRRQVTNVLRKVQSKYNPHFEAKKYELSRQ